MPSNAAPIGSSASAGPAQRTDGQLALELETRDEEEEREQPVAAPSRTAGGAAEARPGRSRNRAGGRTHRDHGELAHASATTVATRSRAPPTVSWRSS